MQEICAGRMQGRLESVPLALERMSARASPVGARFEFSNFSLKGRRA